MTLGLASIIHHFWEYLQVLEDLRVTPILFEYIVWAFLCISFWKTSVSFIPLFFLLLFHAKSQVFPETCRYVWVMLGKLIVRWITAVLLLEIIAWVGLCHCLSYLMLNPFWQLLFIFIRNLDRIIFFWRILEIRTTLTWMWLILIMLLMNVLRQMILCITIILIKILIYLLILLFF